MNTQNTNIKNTLPATSIENRLANLEKAMEIITGLAGDSKHKHAADTIAPQQFTSNKSSNNNMLLSNGQMMATLATAILKANKRNS